MNSTILTNKLSKKMFSLFMISIILISVLPQFSTPVSAYVSAYSEGLSFSNTNKFKITRFGNDEYYYKNNWNVIVDGSSQGQMPAFQDKSGSATVGRTFGHSNNVAQWADAFNGNPSYVRSTLSSQPTKISKMGGRDYYWIYSRDIAVESGAEIDGSGYRVTVDTTPWPLVRIQKPSFNGSVQSGVPFNVTFGAEEFLPASSPKAHIISYKVLVDGQTKATGMIYGRTGTKTESITVSGSGSKTITVEVADAVQRTGRDSIPITVSGSSTTPPPTTGSERLEIRPRSASVDIGQSNQYNAYYINKYGVEKDVTYDSKTNWGISPFSIASINTTGNATGIASGTATVTASYPGASGSLSDSASLYVKSPPPPPNEKPTVEYEIPPTPITVVTGEKFCIDAEGHDSDGTIVSYKWSFTGKGTMGTTDKACDLSYDTPGDKTVTVQVTDDDGEKSDIVPHIIKVEEAEPTAYFAPLGLLKENRKVSLTSQHPYYQYYSSRDAILAALPIVEDKWSIQALNPANQDDICLEVKSLGLSECSTAGIVNKNIIYPNGLDIVFKKEGAYKATRTVKNSLGKVATYESIINIVKDEKPNADFNTATTIYRDDTKDRPQFSEAVIKLTDNSFSRDDIITKRIYSYLYDSDNDGSFTDEGKPIVLSDQNAYNIEHRTNKVGKYLFFLEVWEDFGDSYGQPTIEKFVDRTEGPNTDRRHHNVTEANEKGIIKSVSERVVEVANLAPNVSYDVQEEKKVDVQLDLTGSPYTEDEVQTAFNTIVTPKLAKENVRSSLETTVVSTANSPVKMAATGGDHTILLLENGDVYVAGDPKMDMKYNNPFFNKVSLPGKAKLVASTQGSSFVVLENNELYGAGSNSSGVLGLGALAPTHIPEFTKITIPGINSPIAEIAGGQEHAILRLDNGDVYGSGIGSYIGVNEWRVNTFKKIFSNVKKISSQYYGSNLITNSGVLYSVGAGYYGALGLGNTTDHDDWQQVMTPGQVNDVSGFAYGSIIRINNTLYGTGWNEHGTLGLGHRSNAYNFTKINYNFPSTISDIATSIAGTHIVLTDGSYYATGYNADIGILGLGKSQESYTNFIKVSTLPQNALSISSSPVSFHTVALMNDKRTFGFGAYAEGSLGFDSSVDTSTPKEMIIKPSTSLNGFHKTKNLLFTGLISNQSIPVDEFKKVLPALESDFIGLGNSSNKAQVEDIVNANNQTGTFIDSSNLDTSMDEIANYILSKVGKQTIDLQIDITSSPFTKNQLKAAVATEMNPLMQEFGYRANIEWLDSVPNGFHKSDNQLFTSVITNGPVASTTIGNALANLNSTFIGAGNSTNKSELEKVVQSNNGTYLDHGSDEKQLILQMSEYIIEQLESNKVEVQIALEEGTSYTKLQLETEINNTLRPMLAAGGLDAFVKFVEKENKKIVSIQAGDYFSAVLLSDGTVYAVGTSNSGTIGPDRSSFTELTKVDFPGKVKKLTAGYDSLFAIMENGDVYRRGNGFARISANNTWSKSTTDNVPIKVDVPGRVLQISVNSGSAILLLETGELYGVGLNENGSLGLGTTVIFDNPTKITLPDKVTKVDTRHENTLVLLASGDVYGMGTNANGNLGDGTKTKRTTPVKMKNLPSKVIDISVGYFHSAVIVSSNDVYSSGYNFYGEIGDGTTNERLLPTKMLGLPNKVKKIATGAYHTLLILDQDQVFAVGNNYYGQLGDGKNTLYGNPVPQFMLNLNSKAIDIDGGHHHSIVLTENGLMGTGYSNNYQIGGSVNTNIPRSIPFTGSSSSNVTFKDSEVPLFGTYFSQDQVNINELTKATLSTDAHFIGVGNASNQSSMEQVVQGNMQRGTFINDAPINGAVTKLGEYIIAEMDKRKKMKEIYITLEDNTEVKYNTTYWDYENDPIFKERWKYNHVPEIFENDQGLDNRHMKELPTPINLFSKVGRYQPIYSAKDEPIHWGNNAFDNYRKWAKDADNWFIFVHRKPVPEFSFTLNSSTGDYTIENKAWDLDKYSINVGNGPGIRVQSWSWRLQGETTWKDGLPPSPLARKVYEVKNNVEDFQKREEYLVKSIDGTGVNKPPIPEFTIDSETIAGETLSPTDLSYDPNGDPITEWRWWIKEVSEGDTNPTADTGFTVITTQAGKENKPNILFKDVGTYIIRLQVKDAPGLWSTDPNKYAYQTVNVLSANEAPEAGFTVDNVYVGSPLVIKSTASDPDGDTLHYSYTVDTPYGDTLLIESGNTTLDKNGNAITVDSEGNFNIPTYDDLDVGIWTFNQTVTDPDGETASHGPVTAEVYPLILTGNVYHTPEWEKIHVKLGNPLTSFYSGEKFLLRSDVTDYPIKSNNVAISGVLENGDSFSANVNLTAESNIKLIGDYFEERFSKQGTFIKEGSKVKFEFSVVYDNDYSPENVIVEVDIIGNVYEYLNTRYHRNF